MIDLFKNWLRGSTNWEAEKRLREMAETDTFLADAIEGYDEFPEINHAEKLTALQQRLQKEHPHTTTKTKNRPHWGRAIAASLALVLSLGLFFIVQDRMLEESIVISENSTQKTTAPAPVIEERITTYSDKNKSLTLDTQKPTPSVPANALNTASDKMVPQQTIKKNENTIKRPPTQKPSDNNSSIAVERLASPNLKQLESKPIARITENIAEIPVQTDQSSRTKAKEEVAATTIETFQVADEIADQAVSKKRKTARRKTRDNLILSKPMSGIALKKQAEPIGGFELLTNYMAQNLTSPTTDSPLQGSVLLSFSISSTGELSNFLVVKGLSPTYNQEAIRLLKEGPKWMANGASEATYEVVFK